MTAEEQYKKFEELDKLASQGGGVERVEKQHANGHMTARERIDMLLDKGTFNEIDKFVVHHCTDFGMDKKHIPGDGIVCGYGKIDGRLVYVYAYDFTVYGGTLSTTGAKKIVKVQELALKNGAPVIALNDSGGARIQEGVGSISGYASIFYQNTIASGVIPQISAILGPCAGGACYSPALTDFIFMVITGPDVVKAVTHEEVDKEELGGAYTHSSKSGVTHFLCDTEEETLMSIRELLSFLPSNNMEDAPMVPCTDDIRRAEESLMSVIPDDPNMPYDIKNIIEPVVDNQYFFEVMPHFAKNIVVGFARLGGRSVGIVANQPAYLAGVLDIDASDKASRFIRFCSGMHSGTQRNHPSRSENRVCVCGSDRSKNYGHHPQGIRRRIHRDEQQTDWCRRELLLSYCRNCRDGSRRCGKHPLPQGNPRREGPGHRGLQGEVLQSVPCGRAGIY